MSGAHPWIKYTEWSRQYGDVVHFSAAGQSVIVLSSRKALYDLLEQRGSIYSDRPRLVMSGELAGYVDSVPLTPSGNRHREYRKLMSEALTAKKVQDYYVLEEEKAREYLVDLLRTPEDFLSHTRRTVAAIVFMITHGHELADGKDHLMELAERTDEDFSESSVAGAFMVDVFPILTYLPRWLGFDWMKKEKIYQKNRDAFLNEPYETVKRQVAQGTAIPSFVSSLIERNKNASAAQENIYKWVSGGFYAGGADTSVSAIASFFLAMSLYPEVQRKAQEEIQRVVGPTRLPGFSDRSQLPYVEALMYEVHRWNPVGPTAIPHRVTKDDAYNGYLIPAGSIIIPNSWGVLHDPALYPDPFEFIPDRYLNAAGNGEDGINPDPRKFAFGYGRRVCPGQYLADNSLFIAMVMACRSLTFIQWTRMPQTRLFSQ
ncbi:cytochrome P450 [Hymenopellis radicata]|nr:cytochrome P450 [Hymenopellis radicata]